MLTYVPPFSIALILSLVLTPLVRRLALHIGMVDQPGPRKVHLEPMPLLGGLAIYLAAIITALVFVEGSARSQLFAILTGGTLVTIVGFLDDRGLLHHQVKLMVAMPLAALILIVSGVHTTFFSAGLLPFALPIPAVWLDYVFTFFWIVGITAAFSILDHLDGLCSGVAAVASAAFSLVAAINGQPFVATLAAGMLGGTLGFLRWNFNPAKLFMGDGGAMFLGFMSASLGLALQLPALPVATSWLIPILILGVPIFDTTLITISRGRRGLIPFTSPGKDHTAHRFVNLNLGHRGAVLIMYLLGAVFGVLAYLSTMLSVVLVYGIVVALCVTAVGAIILLERVPYEAQIPIDTAGTSNRSPILRRRQGSANNE